MGNQLIVLIIVLMVTIAGVICVDTEDTLENRLGTTDVVAASSGGNRATKLRLCLNNCALCVRQWETGLYNGERCAKKCLKFKANPRVVDPDCNSLKLFNHKFIKRKNKRN